MHLMGSYIKCINYLVLFSFDMINFKFIFTKKLEPSSSFGNLLWVVQTNVFDRSGMSLDQM
jgi:hypothetical protein